MPFVLGIAVVVGGDVTASASISAGPLFQEFPLTLSAGGRTEALGPILSSEAGEDRSQWALHPVLSYSADTGADAAEFDLLYPVLTYDRFGREYRFQLMQVLSFSGGQTQTETNVHRFTLFPIYFQQRSDDPAKNYTALFPLYGQLRNRLFRDEINFVLWPLYVKTKRRPSVAPREEEPFLALPHRYFRARKGDVTTYNFVAPIFHLRYGDGLTGWQVWPLAGHEHKEVTTKTNSWGDVETVPGHEKRFLLWPIFFNQTQNVGTDNPERQQALLPFYSYLRSPQRDSTSYLWPLGVTITDDRARKYREVDAPWPLIVFAHGEGKTTRRVWPFFSQSRTSGMESDWYLWPIYKYNRLKADPLDRARTRILFFLYSDTTEKNTQTGATAHRADLWPLFTAKRDLNGNERLQILALLEPLVPSSRAIERNYSPLWSLWRAERNPSTGAASQSLLWNLYRRDTTRDTRKCSLLFGLFQYQSNPQEKRWRLFYIPISRKPDPAVFLPLPAAAEPPGHGASATR